MLYTDAEPLMASADYGYEAKDGECRYEQSKGLIAANGMTILD